MFRPRRARAPLGIQQELSGKEERWSLLNESIGPELHVIDRMLRSYRGISRPRGD